jgi:glycosyltransferase involved in cell wall biosynthesis
MPVEGAARRPPHVGLNLIYLVPGETGGTETYARELIPALLEAEPGLRLTAFVNREAAAAGGPWSDLASPVTVPVDARNRLQWVRGEQLLLPRHAAAEGVDVVHSLASTGPARGAFRRVTTIHDLHHRTVPEAHFGVRGLGMRVLVPLAARRSDRVIAPTEAVRDELVGLLGLAPERVDAVFLGTRPPAAAGDPGLARERHRLGERPLLLTVSAKRRHKNLIVLLEALALVPEASRPVLVLPGYPTPHEAELRERATALGLERDTRFPGWIDDEELESLYAAAAGFVFPSLAEGFGLPVLEAMARGLPVACSDRGAVAEVAGDAALLFDPESPRAVADAVVRLLGDAHERERLARAGRARAAEFTWARTAAGTLATYARALGSPR